MAESMSQDDKEVEEEDYVLLDLDSVSADINIPPNAPYVLSGLDTLNPILTIDNKIRLIGEYEETIGTCLVFCENEGAQEKSTPSEANIFSGKHPIDSKQTPAKQVDPLARLHKVLKFRVLLESHPEGEAVKQSNAPSTS